MSCNNCYNGCAETTSDKCVKYTGNDIESLNIYNGDSLYSIDQVILDKLVTILDGTGIDITIDPGAYCELVTSYLPSCKPICNPPTAVELFQALTNAACDLQSQVSGIDAKVLQMYSGYSVGCLTGVDGGSPLRDVVEAIIAKLCDLGVDLSALALDVDTNYVKLADLDALIQSYLDSIGTSTKHYLKMVPYTVVEYYGSLSNFDGTGAGIGDWEKIYLCNGDNGTPDKRGRVGVGAIVGVGGGALDPVVTPGGYNPNYSLNSKFGDNSVTLSTAQIPSHTHAAVVTDTHYHYIATSESTGTSAPVGSSDFTARQGTYGTNEEYAMRPGTITANVGKSSGSQGSISVANASAGSGNAHSNVQPVLACYYIMYIP